MSSFLTSTEFYVIASLAAAAIVGLCVKPQSRGEALEHLLAGNLCDLSDIDPASRLTLTCDSDGKILLTRHGLAGLTADGAVSLSVKRIGTEITIEERITPATTGEPIDSALFTLDFIPPGRYHIRYNSESTGLFSAFTMTVRPSSTLTRPLSR